MSSQAHSTTASFTTLSPTTLSDRLHFDLETRQSAEQRFPTADLWARRGIWLKAAGYTLRSQHKREKRRTWGDGFVDRSDGDHAFDATRTSDGALVSLNLVDLFSDSDELKICAYFSSQHLRSDPRNHCVPILDIVHSPGIDSEAIMVMPLLAPFQEQHFLTVGECVAFFAQIFEGMQFMHRHHVVHRDCTRINIVMTDSPLPHHENSAEQHAFKSWLREAMPFMRSERLVRYYFVNSGLSRQYKPEDGHPRELPLYGGDKSAPEHGWAQWNMPCDPFPTDVYFLGNLVREEFLDKSWKLSFMKTLVANMTHADPAMRPTMDEVVEQYRVLQDSLCPWYLCLRVNLGPRRRTFGKWVDEGRKLAGLVHRRLSPGLDVEVSFPGATRPHLSPA
ncbi:hypothetical protein OF83DRAFT_1068208 [Amylostereum chailletii]|nr:hypothetical protein OF83DRAFT_1068208 [Amylostereum chailletii]